MRLIDADALRDWIEACTEEKDWLVSQYNADWIWSMLDSAPTIDAEPVVRCGECLFKRPRKEYGELHCRILDAPMNNNDFCSYGERRSDG